jgi:formamidopyrimidine-DNA glycosylase
MVRVWTPGLHGLRRMSRLLLRSVDPPLSAVAGHTVTGLRRLGKGVVITLDHDLFLVIHLMIAGRLHWKPAGAKPPGKIGLAAFDFSTGTLTMTERAHALCARLCVTHARPARRLARLRGLR